MNKEIDAAFINDYRQTLIDGMANSVGGKFIPSGQQDEVIEIFGLGKYIVINVQTENNMGKTALVAQIFKNIMWDNDKEYFNYPLFNEWPFKHETGIPVKRARIVGTKENVSETGPIKEEIEKWWPKSDYTVKKHSHAFPKEYITSTGWKIDVLSHEQKAKEHEGPVISLYWIDEPIKPDRIGAIMSRLKRGGVIIFSQTPVDAGPMLDSLDDLQGQGTKIKHIYGNMYENSKSKGKWNKKKTKRGLMEDEEIEAFIARTPITEREARIEGKGSRKSGKVFRIFDRTVHVKNIELDSKYAKSWNNYMIFDPHRRYYPFMLWVGIAPDETIYIWNEWPTYQTLGNNFYDKMRNDLTCPHAPSTLSDIMKHMDSTIIGMQPPLRRFIDPRFAKGTESDWTKDTQGIISEYVLYDVKFELPPFDKIEKSMLPIQEALYYDTRQPIDFSNRPRLYVLPHCINFIRCMERHYWEQGKEKESTDYKDPIDCLRYFFSGVGEIRYIDVKNKKKEQFKIDIEDYKQFLRSGELG